MSRTIISKGNKSNSHINTQRSLPHYFQWKVDITYIPRLHPNSKICSLVKENKTGKIK